jgi:hypothetical protein
MKTTTARSMGVTGFTLLLSWALPLKAQTESAALRGVVQDTASKTLSGAKATLTSITQRRSWSAIANESGIYNLAQIPPGDYDLTIEAQGFRTFQRRGLTLQVAQAAEVDVTFEIGPVTETVTVTAQAPLLEVGTSTLGEVVNARTTQSLPLNGRNVLQLVQLVPGVSIQHKRRAESGEHDPAFRRSAAVGWNRSGHRCESAHGFRG